MTKSKLQLLAREASIAHCDLNIFYAVIALMDGSLVSAERHKSAQRIIAICKAESQKCLDRYDIAMAKLARPSQGRQEGRS